MASSSSSRPNNTRTITYDVFLSFRGEDTRYSFTDHLYKALLRTGIRAFRDDDAIRLGHELKPEIKDAIIESRASIVVLSENYASSRWCLDELSLILEQKRKCNYFVLPVFYRVYPSAVRKQGQSFSVEGSNWTLDTTMRWKEALIEVASLPGMVLSGYKTHETDFIKEVVETVNNQLNLKQLSTLAHLTEMDTLNRQVDLKQQSTPTHLTRMETVNNQLDLGQVSTPAHLTGLETVNSQQDLKQISTPAHLTGLETRVEVINSWFKNEQCNAIAICGMGGSGKTTLARYIYSLNKQDFESSSFVEEIGEHYKHKHGLLGLQKQLLKDVLEGKEIMISSVPEGTHKIKEALQKKKVLIVLDDIDDQEELCALLGTKAFPTQSKIIITTRLLDIDAWFGSISWRCWVHKLKSLNDLESLELFSWHAFGSKIPMEGFKELARQLAQYCGGNPLALEVLGSSLFVSNEDPRKRNNMIEIWRSKINSLNSDLDCKIQRVLQKSFDSLPLSSHRELFLDIACFFVGESKDLVTILRDDLHAKSGIQTLINRCLLTVSPDTGELIMHQLLQDMGRTIVCEESKDPSKRSRVWHDDESYCLLEKDGSNTIESLALNMRNVKQRMGSKPLTLKVSLLAKMNKLKFLQLKYVTLTGSYKNFPMLRWLCWHGCSFKSMPSGLLQSSLVAIDMSYGHFKTFESPTVLNSLKILKLEGCDKLVSIRRLRRLPELATLILSNCSTLTHLSESIEVLESLAVLDLKGCIRLLKASSKKNVKPKPSWIDRGNSEQPLFSLPSSLKFLYLNDCHIEYNNDAQVEFHAQSFFNLCLERNPFEFLPNSIDLKMLKTLNLYACPKLKSLPCIPSTLEQLYVDGCASLERLTFQSSRFSLQQFSYEGCSKLSEVQGLFKLVPIAKIDEADLVQHMKWIKRYEDREVDVVGDDITKRKDREIQMLYEYGIMSTYVQGIKDQSMATHMYTSSTGYLHFCVPFHPKKKKIQGLNVSCLYRSSGSKDEDMWLLLAEISNITKGLTWVYNPIVYCKPKVDENVVWLSYWPIGNILDVGDEVHVDIIVDEGVIVSQCGANLKFMDGEVENYENNTKQGEEVIGGDLSEFEVTRGGYYLCRRDLFGFKTSHWLKVLFDDNVDYPESHGWRKTRQSRTGGYKTDMFPILGGEETYHKKTNMVLLNYDVFLNFKGEDTRHNFTDHLYQALLRAGLRTFRDNNEIDRGQVLKPEIDTAIIRSQASIVVLSENYANSRWCLDELWLILEQRRKCGHFVLPVFYHVEPSDVRKQRGSFAIEGSKFKMEDVTRWKEALTEVANLTGMVISGSEVDFIKEVVDSISRKLDRSLKAGI